MFEAFTNDEHIQDSKPKAEVAIPPIKKLRADHPTIKFTSRGSRELAMRTLSTTEGRTKALEDLDKSIYTENTRKTRESWLATYCWALELWGSVPFPITETKVRQFGATMRAGGFRSCGKFLFRAIQEDERRRKQKMSPVLLDIVHEVIRASERGIGPGVLKVPITIEKFAASAGYGLLA